VTGGVLLFGLLGLIFHATIKPVALVMEAAGNAEGMSILV